MLMNNVSQLQLKTAVQCWADAETPREQCSSALLTTLERCCFWMWICATAEPRTLLRGIPHKHCRQASFEKLANSDHDALQHFESQFVAVQNLMRECPSSKFDMQRKLATGS